jgi:hypothetical protein
MTKLEIERSPSGLGGWVNLFPIAVMGFLSGMFATASLSYHGTPALGPTASAVFAFLTGAAALGFCFIGSRGGDSEA